MAKPQTAAKSNSFLYIICAILTFIAILLWLGVAAPILKKMPENFRYSANILSLDDLYDEKVQKFLGEYISKTTFSYRVVNRNDNYYTIENKFAVRTLNDVPIISVIRNYLINPYTWQHKPMNNKEKQEGFLFGPRYASTHDFYYRHINYNTQILLKFINKQYIKGLKVYHYQAQFTVDQSKDLEYLPTVPEIRGIRTYVNLDLFIEPISGWMVKFIDNSIAYYYDKNTGKIIAPWNQFSNQYTLTSIREQVTNARSWKLRILIIDYGVPSLLVLAALIFCSFLNPRFKKLAKQSISTWKQYRETFYIYFLLFIFIILTLITLYYFFFYVKKPVEYTVGISQWSNNIDLNNTIKGFKEGLKSSGYTEKNVKFIIKNPNANIKNQIDILQSFLDQNVDLLFVLTTPGTLVAKGVTANKPIVFSNVLYPEQSNIISSIKTAQHNLVGIRNYIHPAIQYNAFEKLFPNTKTLGFVHKKGDPESEFQFNEYQKLLSNRGIHIISIPAIDLNDLRSQLLRKDLNYDSLFIACDALIQEGGGKIIAEHSNKNKIPNFSCDKGSIENGALIGVVASPYVTGFMAGKQAALILDGAKPAWLHTEAPDKGTLIINENSAKLLGINIPAELLKQSDETIREIKP